MKSEFNKCIRCKSYSNKWEKCKLCEHLVCPDCYMGKGLCNQCMVLAKSNELVKEYHADKQMGATL